MASASFGCVGHVQPAPWPRGCYCRYDWPQVDVLGCPIYRFLALLYRCSRSDTSAPPVDIPHPTSYTQGWHALPDGLAAGSSCGVTPVQFSRPHRPSRMGGRYTQKGWPPSPLSQDGFSGDAMLFFKSISKLSPKGPFLLYLKYTAGGPKSK